METIKVNDIAGELRLERSSGHETILKVSKIGLFQYSIIGELNAKISESKDVAEQAKVVRKAAKMLFPFATDEDFSGLDVMEIITKGFQIATGSTRTQDTKKKRGRKSIKSTP